MRSRSGERRLGVGERRNAPRVVLAGQTNRSGTGHTLPKVGRRNGESRLGVGERRHVPRV